MYPVLDSLASLHYAGPCKDSSTLWRFCDDGSKRFRDGSFDAVVIPSRRQVAKYHADLRIVFAVLKFDLMPGHVPTLDSGISVSHCSFIMRSCHQFVGNFVLQQGFADTRSAALISCSQYCLLTKQIRTGLFCCIDH